MLSIRKQVLCWILLIHNNDSSLTMRHYKEIKDKDPGKLVTSGGYFDDISHSLLCGGCKSHVNKYTFQQPQSKYQNLFQDSSYLST